MRAQDKKHYDRNFGGKKIMYVSCASLPTRRTVSRGIRSMFLEAYPHRSIDALFTVVVTSLVTTIEFIHS